jgi:ketosteroid isomerase-like protein
MTPNEIFARMATTWLSDDPVLDFDRFTEDAVLEMPFAPPGRPSRIVGRDAIAHHLTAARPAVMPVRFEYCTETAVHETADPDTIVVEYELGGTILATGERASAAFVGVLGTRDGRIALWREYQNVPAIAAAMGQVTSRT